MGYGFIYQKPKNKPVTLKNVTGLFIFRSTYAIHTMSKILLIEDDSKIRSILREILQEKNHEVDEAGDGLEGFKKLEQGIYDLCICDIKMPKMDGLEVLDKAKQEGITANFVIISAHGNIDIAV